MIDELKLLKGDPIFVEEMGYVYPLTLREIADMGLSQYSLFITVATFDIKSTIIDDWFERSLKDEEVRILACNALSLCFKSEVFFDGLIFRTEQGGVITPNNYYRLVEVINSQYGLSEPAVEQYANEKARQIAEKIQKLKPKNEQKITMMDVISGISARHPSINLFTVWDLTVYQLYDQFERLNLIDNYNNTFFLLPHSEDARKELKHWIIKK